MSIEKDRCARIAELLLIENEVKKMETCSCVNITDWVCYTLWQHNGKYEVNLSPIEKLMYAILTRVVDRMYEAYSGAYELGLNIQKQIGPYRVDFLVSATFSDDKIVIECDGHDFHEKTKEQAKHDKERDRYLTSSGYKILRYTGSEIYNDFIKIEKELLALLEVPAIETSLFSERKNG